jgi:hypothetical protein
VAGGLHPAIRETEPTRFWREVRPLDEAGLFEQRGGEERSTGPRVHFGGEVELERLPLPR